MSSIPMAQFNHRFLFVSLILVVLFPFRASAETAFDKYLSVSGFGTVALTSCDSDTLGFKRSIKSGTPVYKGQIKFRPESNFGLQFNFQPFESLEGVVQLLAKDREDNSVNNVFHYAFLKYTPMTDFSIRGGRLPLDIYLLADYREVGFAYLWARPVSMLYSTLFYDYFDGFEMRYQHRIWQGVAELKAYVGSMDSAIPLSEDGYVDLSFEPMWGINLRYLIGAWKFSGGFQRSRIENVPESNQEALYAIQMIPESQLPFASYLQEQLQINGSNSDYLTAGVAYDDGPWAIQTEVSRYKFENALGIEFYSGYLSVGYNLAEVGLPDWTPYTIYSRFHTKMDKRLFDLDTSELSPYLQQLISGLERYFNAADCNEQAVSLGCRWDVTMNVAVKFQWDHTWVENGNSALWFAKGESDGDTQVNVYAMSLNFVF